MIHLFDYSERSMSSRLFSDWITLIQAAQEANTLVRCEYYHYGSAYVVRTHKRQVEGMDFIGISEDLVAIVNTARKRNWVVDIFTSDLKNMYDSIRRRVDDIIVPTDDPKKFLARRV